MKTRLKKIYGIVSLLFCFVLFVCGLSFFSNNTQQKVFAESETSLDKQTQILEEGNIISKSLWNALKQFYNNNKTNEMPSIKTNDDNLQYLTIDLFKDFPISKLNLQNKEIESIENLGIFDLSSFDEIDLSNNQITTLNKQLSKVDNLKTIDVSNNLLNSFDCDEISNSSLTTLTKLDISHNKISTCDLSLFENAEINASHNNITKENLTLPNNLLVKVNLSYNFINSPNTSNTNLSFGLQGIKNGEKYVVGQNVEYYGIDEIENLKIYFQKKTVVDGVEQINETEVRTLSLNETYTFGLGYYRIKFLTTEKTSETQDIEVYIYPKTPTLKMFRNGNELKEIEYTFSSATTIKFYGEENASFAYRVNFGELIFDDEVIIEKTGINIINVYQIIDGYYSDPTTLFVEYKTKTFKGWIFAIVGSAVFVVAFYFIIKYYPVLISKHIGKKKETNSKKNLD